MHLRALAPGAVRIRWHGRPELLQLRQAVKLYLELHADPASSGAAGLLRAPAGVAAALQSGESRLGVVHFLRSRQATLETHAGGALASRRDSGTPIAPLRIWELCSARPARLPMSRTQSCSSAAASSLTPYLPAGLRMLIASSLRTVNS